MIVYTLDSIPSLCTRVHCKIIEAPVGSSRRGAVVPVRAICGLIEILQSLSLSGWNVGEVSMSTAVNIIPLRHISGVMYII